MPSIRARRAERRLHQAIRVALLGLAFTMATGASHAADGVPASSAAKAPYRIPAGPLGRTLSGVAVNAGVALSFDSALTDGLTSPEVSGSYSVPEVFSRLLEGSGLEFVGRGDGSYTLRRQPAEAQVPAGAATQTLPAVAVTAERLGAGSLPPAYEGGQVATGGRLGMLGNVDVMDAPFNITSYTSRTIEDQQVHSVAGILANDPSVRVSSTNSTHNEAFQIRGFEIFSPDIAINGLYGLLSPYRVTTEYAERIEVLKGPSALLGGISPNGSIGGGINIVTKRAADEPLTRLSAGYMSDGQLTTHADIGRRFGQDKEFGVRVNGAYRDGDTAMDGQSQRLALGSVGLDYRGERVRLSLDAIAQAEHLKGGAEFGMRFSGAVPAAPRASTVFLPGSYSNAYNRTVLAHGEFDLTPDVTLFGSYGTLNADRHAALGAPLADAQGNFSAVLSRERRYFDNASGEAGIRGRFHTGSVRHQLSASVSRFETETGFSQTLGTPVPSNIYHPAPVPQPQADPPGTPKTGTTRASSVALADTLSFADDRVLLTLGLRRQQLKVTNFSAASGAQTSRYDESATTPMAAVVVKPLSNLSLYANYIEGLTQGPTAPTNIPGLANPGQMFAPYKSKQYEVGAKMDFGRTTATVSLFQIKRPNSVIRDNTFTMDGQQRNRGIELNVFGEAARGVRLLGGVALLDGKVTKAATPALEGKTAVGVPGLQLNLGAEWDTPFLPGLTLTARGIRTSTQYVDAANTQQLPGWTRFDVGARYATRIAGRPIVLRANIENLFDKNYWSGVYGGSFVSLGSPRTLMLSATVDF
ncbi:TonB-dependent receptor [Pigmentiphaga sp. YJ18]|uniref:TonB-dependent receptor n=1 Tax=Pigmentiphaga sp. YJ18 TaxID=3134907 RepID=UPI00310D68E6